MEQRFLYILAGSTSIQNHGANVRLLRPNPYPQLLPSRAARAKGEL